MKPGVSACLNRIKVLCPKHRWTILLAFLLATDITVAEQTTPKTKVKPLTVISLAPHITEMLFSAGAGKKVIGAVEYSDYPAAANQIPRIGNYHAVNIEKVIQLNPDIIYAWQGNSRKQDIEKLEKLGFKITYSATENLSDIAAEIRKMGQRLNTSKIAEENALQIEKTLRLVKQKYASKPIVTAFYQIWNKPLMTINGKQFISQGLKYCGAKNVFADLPLLASEINLESLFKRNPDMILLGGESQMQKNWLKNWQGYSQLKAVKNQQIYLLNADFYQRPTQRFVMNLEALCLTIDKVRTSK